MDYSKLDLKKASKYGRTLSGSEFELKKWDEMEEGECYIEQMLFVGSKKVKTIHGDAKILEFQHPQKPDIKRSIWGNTLINNALDSGDLFQADYMLYTIEYQGKQAKKSGKGNPYHVLEIYAVDLRKMGFKSSEVMTADEILEDDDEEEIEDLEDVIEEMDEEIEEEVAPVKQAARSKSKPVAQPVSKAKAKAKVAPARVASKSKVKKAVVEDDDSMDDLV